MAPAGLGLEGGDWFNEHRRRSNRSVSAKGVTE